MKKEEEFNSKNPADKMRELVTFLILRDNYWGYLFNRVNRVEKREMEYVMGVAVLSDGEVQLWYNPQMVEKSDYKNLEKCMEHEGMHLLNGHLSRCIKILADEIIEYNKIVKMKIWNYASDAAVHDLMSMPDELTIAGKPYPLIKSHKLKLPAKQHSEFYFYSLLNDPNFVQKIPISMPGSGGEGEGQNGQNQGDGDDNGFGKTLDDHSCWTQGTKESQDLNSLSRKVQQFVSEAARESYKSVQNKGSVPAGIYDLIQEMLKPPKVPYYQIIRKLVKGSRFSKFQKAYCKLNRKRTYLFTLTDDHLPIISPFPGKTRDFSFKIGLLLDTSGSMGLEDILEGLCGVKDIIEHDRHCETHVLEVDADLQKEYKVRRLSDIQFDIKGRGGTELYPGLKRAKELDTDVTLVFTDGFTDNINAIPKRLLPKKIIFVLTENGDSSRVDKSGFIIRLNS